MWFLYALVGAVGKSYSGFFRKKVAASVSGDMYIWIGYAIILVVLSPFVVSNFGEMTALVKKLPFIAVGAAVSAIIATRLNLEALKHEELSYTAPLNAFVPVFTLAIAGVVLNESPPRYGIIGVLTVVIGAYIVNIKPERINWYDPLKRIMTSKGAQLSILVALFYAINTVLLKIMSNNGYSSLTILYITVLIGWLCLVHVPFVRFSEFKEIDKSDKIAIIGGGISSFASSYFHILATASTFTSYATSVRRLDSFISVMLGWKYLKESNIRLKLIGSLVMTIGAVLMAVS